MRPRCVAAATLEAGGDLAGLAEALGTIGTWRANSLGYLLAAAEDLERAATCARKAVTTARNWTPSAG